MFKWTLWSHAAHNTCVSLSASYRRGHLRVSCCHHLHNGLWGTRHVPPVGYRLRGIITSFMILYTVEYMAKPVNLSILWSLSATLEVISYRDSTSREGKKGWKQPFSGGLYSLFYYYKTFNIYRKTRSYISSL